MSAPPQKLSITNPETLKDYALILLIAAVVIVFAVFTIAMAYAIISGQADISFKGEIDLGQFTGIIIGIAVTATVIVSQQLAQHNVIKAIKENDATWLESEKDSTKK